MDIKFGRTANDYATHRQGFPESFFDSLMENQIVNKGDRLLDIGTGTGTIARGFATRDCDVYGVDPSVELLQQAKLLAEDEGCSPVFVAATAENTTMRSDEFDVVTAGQCWHWFNRAKASQEIIKNIKAGRLAHYCSF